MGVITQAFPRCSPSGRTAPRKNNKWILGKELTDTDRIINLLRNLALLSSSKFSPLDLARSGADITKIIKDISAFYAALGGHKADFSGHL